MAVMLSAWLAGTLRGMNRFRARHAFTLVELLVALVMLGVATVGLVSALTGDRRLRDLAASHTFAAERIVMDDYIVRFPARRPRRASLLAVMLCAAPYLLRAQAPAAPPTPPPAVPDWALPGPA